MTVIIGILCEDGVVLGTDGSVTFSADGQLPTIEQPTQKLFAIDGSPALFAGTGQVGLSQRFHVVVTNLHGASQKPKGMSAVECGKALSKHAIEDFVSTHATEGKFGALVALVSSGGHQLIEFASTDFQPELKTKRMWFVSMGIGQRITDPFLGLLRRVFFADGRQPKVSEGVFLVTWALEHAIDVNPGGINRPTQIGVLRKGSTGTFYEAVILRDDQLLEHRQNTDEAEAHLREYLANLHAAEAPEIPDVGD